MVGSCPRPYTLGSLRPWRAQQLDTPPKKATHLPAILQRRGADVLHNIPPEEMCKGIVMLLEGHYRSHQLAMAYHSQVKARP
jgi:hypothetical protein